MIKGDIISNPEHLREFLGVLQGSIKQLEREKSQLVQGLESVEKRINEYNRKFDVMTNWLNVLENGDFPLVQSMYEEARKRRENENAKSLS